MSGLTHIEWTDATWNPVTGCTKVSAGCKNCYAERYFKRSYPGRAFTDVRMHPDRLDWPLRWRGSKQAKAEGRPSRIFVNSMSDLFHEEIPNFFILDCFTTMDMAAKKGHIFQVLTKRAECMKSFFQGASFTYPAFRNSLPFQNVWLGVSVEDQQTADERIPILLQTPAAVRWVSYEPALGPVDFAYHLWADPYSRCPHCHLPLAAYSLGQRGGDIEASGQCVNCGKPHGNPSAKPALDWIVAGGESGPRARPPHPDWFRSVRDQCQAAGVPFFFKQWGEWVGFEDSGGQYRDARKIHSWPDGRCSYRVGKHEAGRRLDGQEWNEFPKL